MSFNIPQKWTEPYELGIVFGIYAEPYLGVEFEALIAQIAIPTTHIVRVGDSHKHIKDKIFQFYDWSIGSHSYTDSKDIQIHLNQLFTRLNPYTDLISQFTEQGGEAYITIVWGMELASIVNVNGPLLTVENFQQMAKYRASLDFCYNLV